MKPSVDSDEDSDDESYQVNSKSGPRLKRKLKRPRVDACCLSKVVIFTVIFTWTIFVLWIAISQVNNPHPGSH